MEAAKTPLQPDPNRSAQRGHEALRLLLQTTLIERCKRNPGYSLRAFAKSLQISHTSLSMILRGSRILPESTRARLLKQLGIGPKQWDDWEEKADASRGSPPSTDPAAAKPASFKLLLEDQFEAISEWYHYALINLTCTTAFDPDPRWIAKRLGITSSEAHAASERLFRLGLLKAGEGGRWEPSEPHFTNAEFDAGADLSSSALRRYQIQVLQGALQAVEEMPVEQRDQSSIAMATSPRRFKEAIARIAKFRTELCEFLEQEEEKTEVYQLSVSLYPLTKIETPTIPRRK